MEQQAKALAKKKAIQAAPMTPEMAIQKAVNSTLAVTDLKLDTAFSKVVKRYYPLLCHSCGCNVLEVSPSTHACHYVNREFKATRWDIRNVLTGCSNCNLYDKTHQKRLAVKIDEYFGCNTAEYLVSLSRKTFQWSPFARKELLALFNAFLAGKVSKEDLVESYLFIKESN